MSIRMDNNRLQQLELSKLKLPQVEQEDNNETSTSPTVLTTSDYEPVTASAANIVEQNMRYRVAAQRGAKYTSVASGIYHIPEGRVVVHNNGDGGIGIQVHGDKITNWDKVYKQLVELAPTNASSTSAVSGSTTTNSINGCNGEINEYVEQGRTGDCWIIAGILALASTEEGKELIKNSMEIHENGNVTITFQCENADGENVEVPITVTAAEIKEHDTDDLYDKFSNGDNDMLAFELAVEKLIKEHPELGLEKILGTPDEGSNENDADYYVGRGSYPMYLFQLLSKNDNNVVGADFTLDVFNIEFEKAGFTYVTVPDTVQDYAGWSLPKPKDMTEDQMYDTNKTSLSNEYVNWYNYTYNPWRSETINELAAKGYDEKDTLDLLQQISELQPCAVTFGLYGFYGDSETNRSIQCIDDEEKFFNFGPKAESPKYVGSLWGHAFAITEIDGKNKTLTFVNPWDSSDSYTVTWEEFAKLGVCSFDVNILEPGEKTEPEVGGSDPVDETPTDENSGKSAKQILGEITTYVFCGGLDKDLEAAGIKDVKDLISIKGEIVNHFTDIGDEILKIGDIKTAVREKFDELNGTPKSNGGGSSAQKATRTAQSSLTAQVINASVLNNSAKLRTLAAGPIVIESGKDFNSIDELKTYLSDQADEIKKAIADSYGIVFSLNNKSGLSYNKIANSVVQKHKTDFRQVTKQQIKEEMVAEYNKRHETQAMVGQQIAMQNLQIISQVKAHITK